MLRTTFEQTKNLVDLKVAEIIHLLQENGFDSAEVQVLARSGFRDFYTHKDYDWRPSWEAS